MGDGGIMVVADLTRRNWRGVKNFLPRDRKRANRPGGGWAGDMGDSLGHKGGGDMRVALVLGFW